MAITAGSPSKMFKVGDRVEVTTGSSFTGDKGVVKNCDGGFNCGVLLDQDSDTPKSLTWFADFEIKRVEPEPEIQAGDTVTITGVVVQVYESNLTLTLESAGGWRNRAELSACTFVSRPEPPEQTAVEILRSLYWNSPDRATELALEKAILLLGG